MTLRAFHQGSNIVIEVSDDGAGLSRERILSTARQRGLAAPDSLSDAEVWALIFEAGFSTADEVTDVSGRGVGMDVVKRNIQSMGGRVEVDSMADVGTTIGIHLPLTLAIMDGMSVRIGAETYVMPLGAVLESLQPAPHDIRAWRAPGGVHSWRISAHCVAGPVLRHPGSARNAERGDPGDRGGRPWPLGAVGGRFDRPTAIRGEKPGNHYRKVDGISGATILGDGQVALILDIAAIARHNQRAAQALDA